MRSAREIARAALVLRALEDTDPERAHLMTETLKWLLGKTEKAPWTEEHLKDFQLRGIQDLLDELFPLTDGEGSHSSK